MRVALCIVLAVGAAASAALLPSPVAAQLGAVESALSGGEGEPPSRHPALDPRERARLDRWIEVQLRAVIDQVDDLQHIEVSVERGVVHLEGTVNRADLRDRARELAESLAGVVYVDDDLQVRTDLLARVETSFERLGELGRALVRRLPLITIVVTLIALAVLLARWVSSWDRPFRFVSPHKLVRGVAAQIAGSLVILTALLFGLELLDATALLGAVLGAAGLAGLALTLSFRRVAENYLASVMLGLRRPFAVGDYVCIAERFEGVVLRLTTRDTVLLALDGTQIRLPNALVYDSVIQDFTRYPARRFEVDIGIAIDEDITRAQAIGIETLRAMQSVIAEPAPYALVDEVNEYRVRVRYYGWVDQSAHDWRRTRSEARRRVKVALDRAGIAPGVPMRRIEVFERAVHPGHPEEPPSAEPGRDEAFDQRVRDARQAHPDEENLIE